ncbi:MAG: hypothetical protein RLZ57_97, partial [Actinomycetota bacterium]
VIRKTIPSFTLTQAAGTGNQSVSFGNLTPGKSYEFTIVIQGITTAVSKYFGIEIISTDAASPPTYDAIISESKTYDISSTSNSHRYTFYVTGTITAGVAETSLIARIVDGDGSTSVTGQTMTATGRAYFIETDSII